jgi:uncharacterized membrane protein YkvA (DUF1232 family)
VAREDRAGDARNGRNKQVKRSGRSPGIRRMIAAAAFMPLAGRAPLYARLIWSLIGDDRVPTARKALLGGALGYVMLSRDIVPDRVPILGQLDDLVVVALAIDLFVDGLDEAVLREKLDEIGIPRMAYDEDVERVRRLVPGPLRRAAKRIPDGIRVVADAVEQSGAPRQLRRWIVDARTAARDAEKKNGRETRVVEGSIA